MFVFKKGMKLFIISFFVYILVNITENMIHYNIGKYSNHDIHFDIPTQKDWVKILIVMITFAGLQGILTCYFDDQC